MSRKPEGERPLTLAERQARHAKRRAERAQRHETALRLIAETCKGKARDIATKALEDLTASTASETTGPVAPETRPLAL